MPSCNPAPRCRAGAIVVGVAAIAAIAYAGLDRQPSGTIVGASTASITSVAVHADPDATGVANARTSAPSSVRRLLPARQRIVADAVASAANPDLNLDGRVDSVDRALLMATWGTDDTNADLNRDGVVDGADLGLLLGAWTHSHTPAKEAPR